MARVPGVGGGGEGYREWVAKGMEKCQIVGSLFYRLRNEGVQAS